MENRNLLTRRDLLKQVVVASVGVLAAPMINRGRFRLFANSATASSARAIELILGGNFKRVLAQLWSV